jgi:hypothetical protein
MFEDGLKREPAESRLDVLDLAEIVARRIERH